MIQTPYNSAHPGRLVGPRLLASLHFVIIAAITLVLLGGQRSESGSRIIQSEYVVPVAWDARTREFAVITSGLDDGSNAQAALGGSAPGYPIIPPPGVYPKVPDPIDGRRRGSLIMTIRTEQSGVFLPTREASKVTILPRLAGGSTDEAVIDALVRRAALHLGFDVGERATRSDIPGAPQYIGASQLLWSGIFGNALSGLALLSVVGAVLVMARDLWRASAPHRRRRRLRAGRCPACRYLVVNLRDHRCPECGAAWTDHEAAFIPSAGHHQPNPR